MRMHAIRDIDRGQPALPRYSYPGRYMEKHLLEDPGSIPGGAVLCFFFFRLIQLSVLIFVGEEKEFEGVWFDGMVPTGANFRFEQQQQQQQKCSCLTAAKSTNETWSMRYFLLGSSSMGELNLPMAWGEGVVFNRGIRHHILICTFKFRCRASLEHSV